MRWDPCSGGWIKAKDGERPFLSHVERKGIKWWTEELHNGAGWGEEDVTVQIQDLQAEPALPAWDAALVVWKFKIWQCGNSKYGSVRSLCFWSTAQIFLGSRIEQPESFLGLSFPYVYAPVGFTTCPSSCQRFLVASGVIKIVSVHLVTCRSPALASMVKAAADHTSELLFSVL